MPLESSLPDVRFRRPEHTGENRCVPCTLVNLVIAVTASAVVGVVAGTPAGVAVFAVSAVIIYLRGYLVPGTPTLTKRYLPGRVLRFFGKDGATATGGTVERIDVERVLTSTGALVECEDIDDLCLDPAFRETWEREMDRLDVEQARDRLDDLMDLDVEELEIEERGDGRIATADADHVGTWESDAALVADVAAATVLRDRVDDWASLSLPARGRLAGGLRLFVDECPTCGSRVSFGSETVESCCYSKEVVAVTCEGCEARLFETEYADSAA